jgi:hypothetical protein
LLALATDGVGSKLQIASALNQWGGVGIDCMAMNVNDLLCVGAEPIAFVDYVACSKARTLQHTPPLVLHWLKHVAWLASPWPGAKLPHCLESSQNLTCLELRLATLRKVTPSPENIFGRVMS